VDNSKQLWPQKKNEPYTITTNLNGFFMVFSSRVLKINKFNQRYYFNPEFPFGGNEVEWYQRFIAKSGQAIVVPQTFVYHYKLKLWRPNIVSNTHCVYTINVGHYDSSISQKSYEIPDNCDFLCITDDEKEVPKIISLGIIPIFVNKDENESFVLLQRRMKAMPHLFLPNKYETSVYIDANVSIKKKVLSEISANVINGAYDIISFDHPERSTVKQEANIVINDKLETFENVSKIIDIYTKDGFLDNVGLTETCVLVRRHKPLIKFSEEWSQLLKICRRDQIMFDYLVWKHKLNINKHFCLRYPPIRKDVHSGQGSKRRKLP
jgi:hypothetical protein